MPLPYDPEVGAPDKFAITADVIAFTMRDGRLHVLLVRRANDPYQGRWALPGGFVDMDEDLPDAAVRELKEETGIEVSPARLTQLGSYGTPGRDPRMRVVTVAFALFESTFGEPTSGDDADDARFWPARQVLDDAGLLAFDHRQIIVDALDLFELEATP